MRFTEAELTAALTGAAKSVLAAQDKSVRKGRRSVDEAWTALTQFERFQLLDGLGDQVLPALVGLPDVEVETGTRPTFTDAQVTAAVEERIGDDVGRVRRAVLLKTRVTLVKIALTHVPPRSDPDALTVPDHL
ncbi:hypothetical protein [Nocardioides sp. URHA0020]|uniref:hypothetical protein n=1 Tax=Nocardioides sp. URHA0020 TaxID=1380392 RepID=UPI0004909A5E|nr:hypothetical protein [Nocardioides sp. URHA0020]